MVFLLFRQPARGHSNVMSRNNRELSRHRICDFRDKLSLDKNSERFRYVNVIYIHNGTVPFRERRSWPTPQTPIAGTAPATCKDRVVTTSRPASWMRPGIRSGLC